ncbi:MAG: oligopeptide ABC transporter permease OppB [Alphaproteobacteria bacterium]|nr:oligopeptide ABC transporter permease OppB [Alphaproteobacteria bacterium]
MAAFVLRRLLIALPTLFVIVTLAFFMMRIAPGGPFDGERALPPEIEANLKAAYNLDAPLPEQYLRYLGGLLRGDFGPSFKTKDFTVAELILTGLPVSMKVGAGALVLALFFGVLLGTIGALRQNSAIDHSVMSLAIIGITIPTFVTAPVLSLVFGVYLGWLPAGGWHEGSLGALILPWIVLSLPLIAIISRLTRTGMIEALRSNFVRTARAKGLPEPVVVIRHALPAAITPLVSYLGPAAAGLLTGSLIVEKIFALPGIGRYFVDGALARDYTLVLGVVVVFATAIVVLNLIADILYGLLDPRVRYS